MQGFGWPSCCDTVCSSSQIKIRQTWSQEPAGYDRTAMVKVPSTSAGQKLPLVIDLHGEVYRMIFLNCQPKADLFLSFPSKLA